MPRAKGAQPKLGGSLSGSQGALQQTLGRNTSINQNSMLEAMQQKGQAEGAGYASLGQGIQSGAEKGVDIAQENKALELQNWNMAQERRLRKTLADDAEASASKRHRADRTAQEDRWDKDDAIRKTEREEDKEERAFDNAKREVMGYKTIEMVGHIALQSETAGAKRDKTFVEAIEEVDLSDKMYSSTREQAQGDYSNSEIITTENYDGFETVTPASVYELPSAKKFIRGLNKLGMGVEDVVGEGVTQNEIEKMKDFEARNYRYNVAERAIEDLDALIAIEEEKVKTGAKTYSTGGPSEKVVAGYSDEFRKKKTAELRATALAEKRPSAGFQLGTFSLKDKIYDFQVTDEEATGKVALMKQERAFFTEVMRGMRDTELWDSKEPVTGPSTGRERGSRGWAGSLGSSIQAMVNSSDRIGGPAMAKRMLGELPANATEKEAHDWARQNYLESLYPVFNTGNPEIDKKLQERWDADKQINIQRDVVGRNQAFEMSLQQPQQPQGAQPFMNAASGVRQQFGYPSSDPYGLGGNK